MKLIQIALLFFMPVLVLAAPVWQMVPAESKLTFTATQNGAPVTGEFKRFSAKINFDRDVMKDNRVEVAVDTGSVSTSYGDLTATLLLPEWFSVKLFPTAAFTATQFKKLNNNQYEASGTLKIRDHIHPITFTFTEKDEGSKKVRVQGSTILKRTAFGVGQGEWMSTKEVKDDVIVYFVVTAVQKP